jgi:hypothetical protein
MILLPQLSKYWNYRTAPPHLPKAVHFFEMKWGPLAAEVKLLKCRFRYRWWDPHFYSQTCL